MNRVATEPFAGRCNPGASGFVKQLKFKRNTYLLDAGITHEELRTLPEDKLPPEQLPSSGQFQTDDEWLYIWFLLQNLPANSIQRVVFRRPNNSVALDTGARKLGNIEFSHQSWWRQRWIVNGMRVFTGTWKLELHVNGKKLATMPYEVMTKRDADLNRAPVALKRVRFRNKPKARRVPLCEIKYPLVTDDPDYDVVSYQLRMESRRQGRTRRHHRSALRRPRHRPVHQGRPPRVHRDADGRRSAGGQQVGPLQGEVGECAKGNASWSEILGSNPARKKAGTVDGRGLPRRIAPGSALLTPDQRRNVRWMLDR